MSRWRGATWQGEVMTDTVDNFDGIPGGLSEATLGGTPAPETDDTPGEQSAAPSNDSDLPTDPEELKSGYLRQADYTRKTQEVAELRRELHTELEKARELRSVMLQGNSGAQQAPTAAEVEAPLPDPKVDAKGWIEGYIAQKVAAGVQNALDSAGVKGLRDEVQPLLQRERLGSEYQRFMQDSPELDHSALSAQAGAIIDSDSQLRELAETNPRLAVNVAAKLAQSRLEADRAKKKNTSRREAAPVAARTASVVNGGQATTLDDAFRLALQQQGIEPTF